MNRWKLIAIGMLAFVAIAFAVNWSYQIAAPSDTHVSVDHVVGKQVVAVDVLDPAQFTTMINAARATHSAKPVILDPDLTRAALAHATDISTHDAMQHVGSDNSTVAERAKRSGFSSKLISELVAVGTRLLTNEQMLNLLTLKHADLIYNQGFTHFGIAKVISPKSTFKVYWVILLASK